MIYNVVLVFFFLSKCKCIKRLKKSIHCWWTSKFRYKDIKKGTSSLRGLYNELKIPKQIDNGYERNLKLQGSQSNTKQKQDKETSWEPKIILQENQHRKQASSTTKPCTTTSWIKGQNRQIKLAKGDRCHKSKQNKGPRSTTITIYWII